MQAAPSDKEIIARVLQGEQKAYEIIVSRYQSFVFTIALRYAGNREDAEELAQNAFIKAYRCLNDYRGDAKFSTWLFTIAANKARDYYRKANRNALLAKLLDAEVRIVDRIDMKEPKTRAFADFLKAGAGFAGSEYWPMKRFETPSWWFRPRQWPISCWTTARRNWVRIRCAMLVSVMTVLPSPMSSHIIDWVWVHWKLTAFFW